jgi:glycosyltransferase involved in cell wall biosynthesis
MKIVFPTMGLSKSGGDRVIIELCNRLALRGHVVTILVSRPSKDQSFDIDNKVNIILAKREMSLLLETFWLVINTPKDTEIVVANYYPTAYIAYIVSFLRGAKAFYLIQGFEPDFFRFKSGYLSKNIRRLIASFSYALPLKKVFVSCWLKSKIQPKTDLRSIVVSNGVDQGNFNQSNRKKLPGAPWTIMFFAKEDRNKGTEFVVKALNSLEKKFDFTALVIMPESGFAHALNGKFEEVRPKNDHELAQCYKRADLFVFASLQEGFGLPPLEAMACGAAVICSNCGGVDDYARDSENCIKVQPKSAQEIEMAIEKLMLHPSLAQNLVRRGLETASSYSWSKTADRFEEYLNKNIGAGIAKG